MNAPCICPHCGKENPGVNLTPQESRVLELLAGGGTVTHEALHKALYRSTEGPEWSETMPGVHISHMRKKGLNIKSVKKVGYRLVYPEAA